MLKSNDWADGAAAIAHVIKARIDTTSDAGEFTARISTGEVDRDGERMAPGALSASIAALKAKGRNLPVLGQSHEWGSPSSIVGYIKASDIRDDGAGNIDVTGHIDLSSEGGMSLWKAMKSKVRNEWSIGMVDVKSHMDGKVRVIDSATLVEVSSCLMGVNPGTATTSLKGETIADILDKDRSGGTMAFYAGLAQVRGENVYLTKAFRDHGYELVEEAKRRLDTIDKAGAPHQRAAATKADVLMYLQRKAVELGVSPDLAREAVLKVATVADDNAAATAARCVMTWEDLHNADATQRAIRNEHEMRALRGRAAEAADPGSTEMVGISARMTPVYAQRHDDIEAAAEAALISGARVRDAVRAAQKAAAERAAARKAEELRGLAPREFGGTQ